MNKTVGVFSWLALITLTGCSLFDRLPAEVPAPVEPEPPAMEVAVGVLEYKVLHKADYNLDDSETFKVFRAINNHGDYQSELARLSVEVPKPVDFSTQQVVALTMGSQPAGGYAVGVTVVEEYTDKVVVTVELKSPGAGCINTEAVSNPYEFTLLPSAKPVEFVEREVVQQCEPAA